MNRLIFTCQENVLLHLFPLGDSQFCFQPLIYTFIFLFFSDLLSEMGISFFFFFFNNRWSSCFLETMSRRVPSSCWWMLANRRCQTQCSLPFITCLKDVPPGTLTTLLPPLHPLRKSLVTLEQPSHGILSGDGERRLQVRGGLKQHINRQHLIFSFTLDTGLKRI